MSQRALELEALLQADLPEVADRSIRRRQLLGGMLAILVGLVAGYFMLAGKEEPASDMMTGEEEFKTTVFRPPSFMNDDGAKAPMASPAVINLPPPAPVRDKVDTTQFQVPPPPAAANAPSPPAAVTSPEAEFPDRYRSTMIVFDQTAEANAAQSLQGGEQAEGSAVAGEDRASRFLSSASNLGDHSAKAKKLGRIDALVPEGTLIPGILETAIVSDLPGQVRAVVSSDVYSLDGRRILIPSGTRLVGEYQSEIMQGQSRVFVVWTRLLRDDGVTVRLNSIGADSLGRAGLIGEVDKKFRERFGAAILLSIVGGGSSYLAGGGSRAAIGNDTGQPEDVARATIAQTFSDMANRTLSESLKIPPTIRISQGERLFVFVRQDLDFSVVYDDPVTEALKDIRRERGFD